MPPAEGPALLSARAERLAAAGFLVLAALLAVTALLADSAAFDEVIHLPAGIVQLKTGDLRLAPDHPPLARLWAALPELLLGGLGLAAIAARRAPPRGPLLASGLVVFALSYGGFAVLATVNIGERHLLPLHPILAVAAGAGAAWAGTRWGKALLLALVLWLGAETALVHPNELGYFNETVGGWRNGWRWLADSNVDWGQDLTRLARWTKENGDPEVKLAYFGAVDPRGLVSRVTNLSSAYPFGEPARLTPGVYVVSVNQLLGLFIPAARDGFWEKPRTRDWYASRWEMARASGFARSPSLAGREAAAWEAFEAAERGRLLRALRARAPDAFIGTSLRVYRLSQADLDAILTP